MVFVNPADIESFGLTDGARDDLISEFAGIDGHLQERRAKDFNVVAYSTPRGNGAAYYPETNPLVPLDHTAAKSNTPVSKAIVIRLEAASGTEHWGHSPRERGPHPPEGQGDDKGTTQWGA